MKLFSFFMVLPLNMLTSALSAMEVIPSLNRLSLQAVAKSVSPTQFIEKPFIYTVGHLYPEVGLELIGRDDIHDKDKAAVAKSVIAEVLEGVARETDFDKKLKPFITVFAQRYVKDTLAPNPYITFRAVKAFKDSVTNALAELQISEESKKLLKDDTTIDVMTSLIPLYAGHPYVLERVKASLLKNIESAEIPEGFKRMFAHEIHRIKSLERKIELEECKRDFSIGAQTAGISYVAFLGTLMAEIGLLYYLHPYLPKEYTKKFLRGAYILIPGLAAGFIYSKKIGKVDYIDQNDAIKSAFRSNFSLGALLFIFLGRETIGDFLKEKIQSFL